MLKQNGESEMKDCPYCFRPITKEILALKKKIKSDNAKAGLEEAKARGKHIGRPYLHNYNHIYNLRLQGLSYREIAKELSIAKSTVQSVLKRRTQNENR